MSDELTPLRATSHTDAAGEARQIVRSPEQVALHLPIAGPSSRMLAYAIDAIAIFFVMFLIVVLLILFAGASEYFGSLFEQVGEDLESGDPEAVRGSPLLYLAAIALLLQLAVEWGYFILFETTTNGRSIGKYLVGLRVVCDGGVPLTLRESLIRNLLRMVDMLPQLYLVGLVAHLMSADGKRLGDFAAGTIVVRLDRPQRAVPIREADASERAAFRFDREQIARLGRHERALIRQTLRRADGPLGAEARAAILARAVSALRERLGYAEEVAPEEHAAFLRALLEAVRRR